jgi:predicted metal-dependent HD superfamily phosphohydrolase
MQFEEAARYITNRLSTELPLYLNYHNVEHTKDVYEACKRLTVLENIDDYETRLLLTAAFYHDSGFLKCYDEHEQVSCDILRTELLNYGYTPQDIDQICSIIMATHIPQDPKNQLGEIIADADLDYLGRDDFFLVSNKLFLELLAVGKVESIDSWDKMQVDFLENHRYFTEGARQLRRSKKEEHLKQFKAKLIKEL